MVGEASTFLPPGDTILCRILKEGVGMELHVILFKFSQVLVIRIESLIHQNVRNEIS